MKTMKIPKCCTKFFVTVKLMKKEKEKMLLDADIILVPVLADNEYIAYVYIRKCFKGINNVYVCICIMHLYNTVINMYNLYAAIYHSLSSSDFKIFENLQKL